MVDLGALSVNGLIDEGLARFEKNLGAVSTVNSGFETEVNSHFQRFRYRSQVIYDTQLLCVMDELTVNDSYNFKDVIIPLRNRILSASFKKCSLNNQSSTLSFLVCRAASR